MILWWILSILVITFGLVVFRGAPYVPTHRKQVEQALDMLDVPKGSTIVDLGSGDGVFLLAAAKRGYKAVGYELNVILWIVSSIRCWRYRDRISVRLRDSICFVDAAICRSTPCCRATICASIRRCL